MRPAFRLSIAAASFLLCASTAAAPLSWSGLQALPAAPPGQHLTYGEAPPQFGELRVPDASKWGKGPFPVLILIHGGCWQAQFDYAYITRLAAWFTQQGLVTWTIEYRRVGDAGGGWPGTFQDAAAAADALRGMAKAAPLDLKHVYAAGHSAGGQLALWLAARGKLPADSELYVKDPLKIRGVIGLAAITDMDTYRIGPADTCHVSVDEVLGGDPGSEPARYAQTSPRRLLPLGVPQVFVQGDQDPIVAPQSVSDYVAAAKAAGDKAEVFSMADAGHFDAAAPVPASLPALRKALHALQALAPASK